MARHHHRHHHYHKPRASAGKIAGTILLAMVIIGVLYLIFTNSTQIKNAILDYNFNNNSNHTSVQSIVQLNPVDNCTANVNSYVNAYLATEPHGTQINVSAPTIFYYDPSNPDYTGIGNFSWNIQAEPIMCGVAGQPSPYFNYVCNDLTIIQQDIRNPALHLNSSNQEIIGIGYILTIYQAYGNGILYKPLVCDYKGSLLPH